MPKSAGIKKSKFPKSLGKTTANAQHRHEYYVNSEGNGWAYEAVHPKISEIRHVHEIKKWVVLESKSSCFPHCKDMYGYIGAPPHSHGIENSPNINKVQNYRMSTGKLNYSEKNKKALSISKMKSGKITKVRESKNDKKVFWSLPKKYQRSKKTRPSYKVERK